jgi:hypothetical protein
MGSALKCTATSDPAWASRPGADSTGNVEAHVGNVHYQTNDAVRTRRTPRPYDRKFESTYNVANSGMEDAMNTVALQWFLSGLPV